MYVTKKIPLVIIFSFVFAFKPLPKRSDSYSKNISKENLEAQYKKSCSTNKNSFNNVQPSEFPSDYSRQRDRNVEIPINYHVIYVAGDSIYMNVTVDNQQYPHCSWDIRDNDNNTFLLYPGFEFDYPGHSYSIGGILPPGSYSLFLYDEFGTGGVSASVTTSSGQVLASVNMGSWGNYTFLNFTAPEGDYVNGLISTAVIEQQTEVLNNAYNDFGYTFVTSNIDSAVNAGWYYATDSHKFETGQWENTDQYLEMADAMTVDVAHSINYFWTGARLTSGLGVHPWSFPEDDSRHGLFCGNYTIPGGEPGLNLGITGVHEVGHYLGLYHTFENGCSSPGDEVEDTPYQSEANYSCPTTNYSCGSYDDIGNYMDYMDDDCLTHFTQGQKDRIDWAIETYRPILLENTTLDYTGPVWHVATTGSDDMGVGSEGNPFATIQKGIDSSVDGDTILVAAGTYVENINYNGNSIVLQGEDRETTIIDGNQVESVVTFHNGEDSTAVISGFTLINGNAVDVPSIHPPFYSYGGGININAASPTISNLKIMGNTAYIGGGISINNYSNPKISNVIIIGNESDKSGGIAILYYSNPIINNALIANNTTEAFWGGVIYCEFYSSVAITNSTLTENIALSNSANISLSESSTVNINNSILWNNSSEQFAIEEDGELVDPIGSPFINVAFSNIQGGWEGNGNIDSDPLFCTPDSGDYSLAETSPCLGTGENGVNMGHFGVGCSIQIDWNFSLSEPVIEVMGASNEWNPGDTISITMDFCNNTDVAHNYYPGVTIESDSSLTSLHSGHIWFYAMFADTCHAISWGAIANPSIISDTVVTFSAYPEALNCQNQTEYCIDGDTLTFDVPIVVQVASAEPEYFIPEVFALHQNYPNPFNPVTSLRYDLPKNELVKITIYDMMGREVKTLVNNSQTAGYKSVQWNATNNRNESVSVGLYLYMIQAGDFRQTKKMLLLK